MSIYICVFLFFLTGSILSSFYRYRCVEKYISFLLYILMILFVSLRQNGYDYTSYNNVFELIQSNVLTTDDVEYLYYIINAYSPSYQVVQLVLGVINCTLIYLFVRRFSSLPSMSLFILLCTFLLPTFMGQHRQAMAISISLWAFVYKNNLKIFLSLWLLAVLSHNSAIFTGICLFLDNKFYSRAMYCKLLIMSIVIRFVFLGVKSSIAQYLPQGMIQEKFSFYESTENYSLFITFAVIIRLYILYKIYSKRKFILSKSNGFIVYFFNLYLFSVIIYWALGVIPQLGGRSSQYFSILEIILVPLLLKYTGAENRLKLYLLFVLVNTFRYINFFLSDFNYQSYIPYIK